MTDRHELSVTRLIDAPRAAVWKIATERLTEWWCPRPWTTEIVEQDWRPGGRSAMVLRGPDGESHELEGVFLEVVPDTRFVSTDAYAVGWIPKDPFMTGMWEFANENGKTRYTATARHWTKEAKDQHEAMGFVDGWQKCAEQLAEIAEREA
ncbi:ATPase [Sphingomonas sp. Leaf357]|uniref:SRPBCC family protein n=1 Tax=Sphingomonas sp. Leaf357 TaxID=1736350 RepID=UPI0006F6F807|nr:SRPBCC family protein [Sphingomonas sp. Leaf357]KQS02280.1 ATPase [Sphingomonas sp. Leaf357]